MELTTSQLSAISRLFSSSVIREMAKKGRSLNFANLFSETRLASQCPPNAKVADAFDIAFKVLGKIGLRDEYIYRAALTRNVLLGTHSLKTASMLSEFRAGSCKADVVILNGTSTVYEIKSERDSLSRLKNQIENYKSVFAKVYVIAGENHVRSILASTPSEIGVLCLSSRNNISSVRDAIDQPDQISPTSIFESIRTAEAKTILNDLGVEVPNVPNTEMHAALRNLFQHLPPMDVHSSMVKTLKRTRNLTPLANLVEQLPKSLHAAALTIPIQRGEHDRLVQATNTPLMSALQWN